MKKTPHSTTLLRVLAFGALTACSAASLPAATTLLINENFSSYTNTTELAAGGWYSRNTNSAGGRYAPSTTLSEGAISGTSLRNGGGSTANTWTLKQWAGGTTLASVGDSLTLSFDAKLSAANQFDVVLFNASQTLSGDALGGVSPIAGATGYGYSQALGVTPAAGMVSVISGSGTFASGTTPSTSSNDINTFETTLTTQPAITGSVFSFSLNVEKSSEGAVISFFQGSTLLSSWTDTSATGDVEFNTLKIRIPGTSFVDNVVLTHTTAIPEPATAALLVGGGMLALAGAGRRRRRG